LWKSADKASLAAETLAITADRLKANGLVDRIVEEPVGGAQRDWDALFQTMRRALTETLSELRKQPLDTLLDMRYKRLRAYGSFKETPAK
jgi:acetyl-CoA carboxylase carboxyl transferase subunit alpha